MKKYILIFFLIVSCSALSFSQNNKGTQLLDKVAAQYNKSKGISTTFVFETKDPQNKRIDKSSGELKMYGKKFLLTTSDIITWFDGLTQWSYIKSGGEVNVSTPTQDELQAVNPYILLKLYKKGYTCNYKGINKNKQEMVELIPTKGQSDYSKIILTIDPIKLYPIAIDLYNKNKTTHHIDVTQYKTGLNYPNTLFVFNKKEYPGVDVIDLR